MQTLKEFRVEFDFILHSGPGTLDNRESAYLIIVTDATDAVSVNFFGRCKFLQI